MKNSQIVDLIKNLTQHLSVLRPSMSKVVDMFTACKYQLHKWDERPLSIRYFSGNVNIFVLCMSVDVAIYFLCRYQIETKCGTNPVVLR